MNTDMLELLKKNKIFIQLPFGIVGAEGVVALFVLLALVIGLFFLA